MPPHVLDAPNVLLSSPRRRQTRWSLNAKNPTSHLQQQIIQGLGLIAVNLLQGCTYLLHIIVGQIRVIFYRLRKKLTPPPWPLILLACSLSAKPSNCKASPDWEMSSTSSPSRNLPIPKYASFAITMLTLAYKHVVYEGAPRRLIALMDVGVAVLPAVSVDRNKSKILNDGVLGAIMPGPAWCFKASILQL